MATITYQCSICDRRIDLVENRQGLTAFGKCVITNGCRGKLNKVKRNLDNVREEFPPEINGLQDYIQRKALYNFTQNLPSSTWIIKHGLGTSPAIDVYTYDANQNLSIALPNSYTITFVDKDTLQVSFKSSFTGMAQLVSRTSVKIQPKTLAPTITPFQVTSNGVFIFAIPKYLTRFDYPPSLLPPPTIPYDLANAPIRIEVSIQRPNTEEEICTEYLDSSLSGTPWSDWNEVIVRKRRNHYLFTKNILDFRTFGGDDIKITDIPYGTQLKITRIDYGTGVLQTIPSEGLCVLLANSPYTSNDKIKDKLINAGDMVKNDSDYFSFTGTEFVADISNVVKTYPDIVKVTTKNIRPI